MSYRSDPREEMLTVAETIIADTSLRLILDGLNRLAGAVAAAVPPPPVIHIPPVDLSAIVTAVTSLKPGVDAHEIAEAIVSRITPAPASVPEASLDLMEKMNKLLTQLEFRLRGNFPAFGASGPSNISDNPNRLLGIVTVNPIGPIPNTTRLLDYAGRTDANPVYIGQAPQGTATGALSWQVQKLSYDNQARLTEQEYLSGIAWDSRTGTSW